MINKDSRLNVSLAKIQHQDPAHHLHPRFQFRRVHYKALRCNAHVISAVFLWETTSLYDYNIHIWSTIKATICKPNKCLSIFVVFSSVKQLNHSGRFRWSGAALSKRARFNGFGWSSARNRTRAEDFIRHRLIRASVFPYCPYSHAWNCTLHEPLKVNLLIHLSILMCHSHHKTVAQRKVAVYNFMVFLLCLWKHTTVHFP